MWQGHPRACSPWLESLPIQRGISESWLETWGRRREQRLCSPRLGGERSPGILKANNDLESITAGAIPALGVMDAPRAPSLISILLFLIMGATHAEQESHSRGKGNIPFSLPGCCLMASFPLPLPLEQSSGMGPAAVSLLGKFQPLPKLGGSSGREFLSRCVEDWRVGCC